MEEPIPSVGKSPLISKKELDVDIDFVKEELKDVYNMLRGVIKLDKTIKGEVIVETSQIEAITIKMLDILKNTRKLKKLDKIKYRRK